jgi:hypothetical protein
LHAATREKAHHQGRQKFKTRRFLPRAQLVHCPQSCAACRTEVEVKQRFDLFGIFDCSGPNSTDGNHHSSRSQGFGRAMDQVTVGCFLKVVEDTRDQDGVKDRYYIHGLGQTEESLFCFY